MSAAEKRLHKIAQRDRTMFKRAEQMGLNVNLSALETYIQQDFLNQGIDHIEPITQDQPEPVSLEVTATAEKRTL